MKIGYLVHNLNPENGGGRFALGLIRGVESQGHQVVIAKEVDDGGEGVFVLKRGVAMIGCIPRLRKLFQDCDVIHAIDGYPYGVLAWLANLPLHKKLVISAQGTYAVAPLYRWPSSMFLKSAYRAADTVIAISSFTKREILKKISIGNIVVIPHGIRVDPSDERRFTPDTSFILSVGGLKERKGYHVSIPAFAQIAAKFPYLQYRIVGDENVGYHAFLDRLIGQYGIEGRVEFLRDMSEEKLQELYRSAELFVLIPINTKGHHIEGFGLVYLEAAKTGLPVIGTLGTGAEDAVKDGYNGTLVPQNDVQKTTEAMSSILSDKEEWLRMSRASYEWAKENSMERQIGQYIAAYQGMFPQTHGL